MYDILPLALKCMLSLVISTIVIHTLLRHFTVLLQRLCQDATTAAFWKDYTRLTLVLVPLVLLILTDWLFTDASIVDSLRICLLSIFAGLLLGLIKIKRHIDRFIFIPDHAAADVDKQEPKA